MARRASSKTPVLWIVIAIMLLLGGAIGGFFIYRGLTDPYRTLQSLDVAAYLDNANSLRGNTYKVEGVVQNSLAWSPKIGRLFSIEVTTGTDVEVIPVLIPLGFNQINVQKGQKYFFKVEIGKDGIILTQDLTKA